ncbi:hypothetical protein KUCAC02_006690, partial [Chaenocephalus aceratus]
MTKGTWADCDARLLGPAQHCFLVLSAGGNDGVQARTSTPTGSTGDPSLPTHVSYTFSSETAN